MRISARISQSMEMKGLAYVAALLFGMLFHFDAQALTINVVGPDGQPIAVPFRWLVEEDATKDVDFTPAQPGKGLSAYQQTPPPRRHDAWAQTACRVLDTMRELQLPDGNFGYGYAPDQRRIVDPDGFAGVWFAAAMARAYQVTGRQEYLTSARKAMDWLQERLAATQQGMRDAQDRLFQSYRSQDLFVPEGSVTAVSTSIAKLQEDFVLAQARRIAIEAALKQAGEMRAHSEELDALPQVAADPVVTGFNSQLASLSVELGRLGEKYREGHPEVQKVKPSEAPFNGACGEASVGRERLV